jgi:hypothetical protein
MLNKNRKLYSFVARLQEGETIEGRNVGNARSKPMARPGVEQRRISNIEQGISNVEVMPWASRIDTGCLSMEAAGEEKPKHIQRYGSKR